MKSLETIIDIVRNGRLWARAHDKPDDLVFRVHSSGAVITELHADEFALVHPRFPNMLLALLEENEKKGMIGVDGSWPMSTLRLWNNEMIVFPDLYYGDVTAERVDTIVRNSRLSPEKIALGIVKAQIKEISFMENNAVVTVTYVAASTFEDITIYRSWLDENYPQWNTRMDVLESIGASTKEIIASVFSDLPKQYNHVTIPELHLD